MGIRDRIRRAKERRRMVDEAIDRQLTPEMKLELARNRDRIRVPMWILVILVLNFLVTIVLVGAVADTHAGLTEHFGENVWENIRAVGREKVGGSLPSALYILMLMLMFFIATETYYTLREGKEYQKLRREVLARAEKKEANP